jgi:hypothetical protein
MMHAGVPVLLCVLLQLQQTMRLALLPASSMNWLLVRRWGWVVAAVTHFYLFLL